MEHSDFIHAWNAGKLEVAVDRSKALEVANSIILPQWIQADNLFCSWIWILAIPTALVVMFLYKWWAGLLTLVILTPILSRATRKSALQSLVYRALENPEFYQFVVSKDVIRVREKP